MKISRAAAGVSFFGALAIGSGIAGLFAAEAGVAVAEPTSKMTVTYKLAPVPEVENVEVRAADLVGTWRGTWDHAAIPAAIEIRKTDGDRFVGTLKQGEAEVTFEGTFHSDDRRIFFRETKVVTIGTYNEWSLGTNSGSFSSDGQAMTGTGIDRWGPYKWSLTKE